MFAKKFLLPFVGLIFINTAVQGEEWGLVRCLKECTNSTCADASKRKLCETNCAGNIKSIDACMKAKEQASPLSEKPGPNPRTSSQQQSKTPTPTTRTLPTTPKAQPSAEKQAKEGSQCICLKMGSLQEKLSISCNNPTLSGYGKGVLNAKNDPCSTQCSRDSDGSDTLKSFSGNNATGACEQEANILKGKIEKSVSKYDNLMKEAGNLLQSQKEEIHSQYKDTLTKGISFF